MRRFHKNTTAALGAVVLMLGAAACGGGNPTTDPSPTQTPSSPTTSPTQDTEAWKSQFTPEQLNAYDAALQRFESYESRAEPIWAKGKATPAAEALFKEYWIAWQVQYSRLKIADENGITVSGLPDVLWSKAKSIDLSSKDAGGVPRVVIHQCIDPSTITVLPTTSGARKDPYLRTITLDRPDPTSQFKIAAVADITNQKQVKSCEP